MSKQNMNTIFDFEIVSKPIEAESRYQKSGISWWENNILLACVAVAMAMLDMFFLFDMMDLVMDQNQWLGKIGAFGIALILNFLPLLIANLVNKSRYGLDHNAKEFAIIGVVFFAILYIGIVLLRFQCLELYTSTVNSELVNTAVSKPTEVGNMVSEASFRRAIFTAVLLSLEPLGTSAFSFLLAIQTDNSLKKQINFLKTRKFELKAAHNRISTAIVAMWEDKEFLMECDRKQYETARDIVVAEAERLKTEARMMLAEQLKDSSAITYLAQDDDTCSDSPETGGVGLTKDLNANPERKTSKKVVA